jgi:hypothetical protein
LSEKELIPSKHGPAPARDGQVAPVLHPSRQEKPADAGARDFRAPASTEAPDSLSGVRPRPLVDESVPPRPGLSPELLASNVELRGEGAALRCATRGAIEPSTALPPLPRYTSVVTAARASLSRDGQNIKLNLQVPDKALPVSLPASGLQTYPPQALPLQAPSLLEAASARGQMQARRRFEQRESQDRRHSAGSESAIQVTIGRIEVRAESSSSQPARERPGPKPLSLQEYLHRQVNRGGK